MPASVSQTATLPATSPGPMIGNTIKAALAVWLGIVLILGASGAYLGAPGQPPLPVFAGAVVPLLVFAIALRLLPAFREFLLALDLRLIVGIQAWRWAGFGFVALYANHVLPGLFAWPAGLGDMAIGVVAPWWIVALSKNPDVAASSRFRLWNALGILDFVVAFTTATICAMTITTDTPPTIAPMGQLPLVLIPAFMVPLFVMLHVVALLQAKRARA
ncbi:hypothetical protein [Rudaea sp.]|uniref:hypothetical protein n=1 Tax=Rudaea sp. TaxID=2136325 RepID=UPI002ED4669A